MLSTDGKLELELTERYKKYTSIKLIEVSVFEFTQGSKTLFITNRIKTKGIIKVKINESEYIADVLIYGDVLKQLQKQYSDYQIKIDWLR